MFPHMTQEEYGDISENTKWGLKKRMRDNKAVVNCNCFIGYDKYKDGKLVINREEAKVGERIFREYVGCGNLQRPQSAIGYRQFPEYKWQLRNQCWLRHFARTFR